MKNLSICIPSNRKLPDSQRSLDSALTFSSQRPDCEVSISDNSNDRAKFEKYSAINNQNIKYATCDFDEVNNWRNAAIKSTGKYIGIMADDDFLLALGPGKILEDGNNTIGHRPNFAVWEKDKGITHVTNFAIAGKTAKERVEIYFQKNNGSNNTLYSFFKRELVLEINHLCTFHPIKAGYYDWAVVLAYVSSGNIYPDNSSLYVYDNQNWSGSQAAINFAIKNLLNKGGLDYRAPLFLYLLLAIDSFILIYRNTSPVDKVEILDAAMFSFVTYINSFLSNFNKNKSLFSQPEVQAINNLSNSVGLSGLLLSALKVLEIYKPELVPKYIDFYSASIGEEWGNVRST